MTKLNKFIEYLLYLFVFLLPFQTRFFIEKGSINGGYSEYATISLYAFDIILLALLVVFLIKQRKDLKNTGSPQKLPFLWWLIAGLDLAIFISVFTAEDHILSIYRYAGFLLGAGLFWVAVKAEYSRIKMFFALSLGIFVHAGFGVWQFLTQSDFACKWLGMAGHSASVSGTSVVEVAEAGERWLRAYGGLPHPNILGGVLAAGILIILRMLTIYDLKKKSYLLPLTSYLLLLLFTTALFFTFSRTAWLALSAGLFIFLAGNYLGRRRQTSRRTVAIVCLIILLAGSLSFFYKDIVSTRIWGEGRLEAKSVSVRTDMMGEAWRVIKDNPVLGARIGNYSLTLHNRYPDKPAWSYQPVHNTFLLVWAEIGLVGLVFFVGVLAWIASILYRREDHWGLAVLSSLMVILIFEHWLWSLHFGMLWFWFILGVVYKKKTSREDYSKINSKWRKNPKS
jgi:O-antigen ligase